MDIQRDIEFCNDDETLIGVIQAKIEKKKMEWFVTRLLSHDINRLKTLLHQLPKFRFVQFQLWRHLAQHELDDQ